MSHIPSSQSGDFRMETIGQRRAREADNPEISPTLLSRERALRGHDIATAAKVMGVAEGRLKMLEEHNSFVVPTYLEERAISKYALGADAATMLMPNDADGRAKVSGRL